MVFGGPIASGAVFLLMPADALPDAAADTAAYTPVHKGGIVLTTGIYRRRNDDLVVEGTPRLVLRRTYLSRYRVSRHFGIGASHDGEMYLIGDPVRFQWAELIPPDGARVRFERTTPGTSVFNAMFEHRGPSREWDGARLGWTGRNWALRRRDGGLMLFHDYNDWQKNSAAHSTSAPARAALAVKVRMLPCLSRRRIQVVLWQ